MPKPDLHLGDVSFMLQGIGGRCSTQAMDAQPVDLDAGLFCVGLYQSVDATGRDAQAFYPVPQWYEQRGLWVGQPMPRAFQVCMNPIRCYRMLRELSNFAAFALNQQMSNASTFNQVIDLQLRSFLPAQTVVQQHGQDCPIA